MAGEHRCKSRAKVSAPRSKGNGSKDEGWFLSAKQQFHMRQPNILYRTACVSVVSGCVACDDERGLYAWLSSPFVQWMRCVRMGPGTRCKIYRVCPCVSSRITLRSIFYECRRTTGPSLSICLSFGELRSLPDGKRYVLDDVHTPR